MIPNYLRGVLPRSTGLVRPLHRQSATRFRPQDRAARSDDCGARPHGRERAPERAVPLEELARRSVRLLRQTAEEGRLKVRQHRLRRRERRLAAAVLSGGRGGHPRLDGRLRLRAAHLGELAPKDGVVDARFGQQRLQLRPELLGRIGVPDRQPQLGTGSERAWDRA